MIVIFFIVFLMLLDLVNFRNPFANRVGRISFAKQKLNAFFTGFFAVLIASPCTAPFMGIAIGYTLAKPIYVYYPVFLSLSLGYALPFTLIGLFPDFLARLLPKPGRYLKEDFCHSGFADLFLADVGSRASDDRKRRQPAEPGLAAI